MWCTAAMTKASVNRVFVAVSWPAWRAVARCSVRLSHIPSPHAVILSVLLWNALAVFRMIQSACGQEVARWCKVTHTALFIRTLCDVVYGLL